MKMAVFLLALLSLVGSACAEFTPESFFQAPSEGTQQLPGIELAEGISQITGTAVSPLLGMSAVGAWKYYRTPAVHRHRLPWFCHPFVWTAGFILLGLCFLKDVIGTGAPSVIKKPLDLAELFENKLSAIVASSAFVPIIAAELARHSQALGGEPSAAVLSDMHYAAMPFLSGASSAVTTFLAVGLALVGFAVVWLSCHAINVLIALSPFTIVDAGLKLIKAGLLSVVTASAFVNPWIGAAICFGIILVAGLIAPWAFRFTLFGTFVAADIFRFRILGRSSRSDVSEPRVFTARQFNGIPVRTLGRMVRTGDDQIAFRYRPWIVLPARQIALPAGSFALSTGLLCPVLLHCEAADTRSRSILLLLPRYCSQEAVIAEKLGIAEVQDGGVLKGFKAMRAWLADMVGLGRKKPAAEPICDF